jgi:hypothetical protein
MQIASHDPKKVAPLLLVVRRGGPGAVHTARAISIATY